MTRVKDITAAIEEVVPLRWQESYDNAGLIVGDPEAEISSALLCVDITEEVVDEAISLGAGMIIAHHPIIFKAIKRLTGRSWVERVVTKAIKHDIALYACHTNLDSAPEVGTSHYIARLLDLKVEATLQPSEENAEIGIGVVCTTAEPMEPIEVLKRLKERLGLAVVRHSDLHSEPVTRVAICTGSGSSLMEQARRAGAQIYIASDFSYHHFADADRELTIADIGHFESEYCAIDILFEIIRKKITTFALHKSNSSRNWINYLI